MTYKSLLLAAMLATTVMVSVHSWDETYTWEPKELLGEWKLTEMKSTNVAAKTMTEAEHQTTLKSITSTCHKYSSIGSSAGDYGAEYKFELTILLREASVWKDDGIPAQFEAPLNGSDEDCAFWEAGLIGEMARDHTWTVAIKSACGQGTQTTLIHVNANWVVQKHTYHEWQQGQWSLRKRTGKYVTRTGIRTVRVYSTKFGASVMTTVTGPNAEGMMSYSYGCVKVAHTY